MSENIFKDIKIFQPSEEELSDEEIQDAEDEETDPIEDLLPVSSEPEILPAAPIDEPIHTEDETHPEDVGHITELVCQPCLELNLLTKSTIKCVRCDRVFCLHFASTVDAQYCVNCLSDISMTRQVVTKTYEHKNAETGEATFYRRRARDIKIEGLDWLFSQRKISELSDVELDLSIEYHRNILQLMLAEQERRRTEKMHRYAGSSYKIKAPGTPSSTSVHDSTTTTVKKVRTVSKEKGKEQLMAILNSLAAGGKTPDQILAILKAKK